MKYSFNTVFGTVAVFLAVFAFCVVPADRSFAQDTGLSSVEKAMQELARTAREHTVTISAAISPGVSDNAETSSARTRTFRTTFSGVIVREGGYIVTVGQPVSRSDQLTVRHSGVLYNAEITGVDERTNLAVIQVENPDLSPIEMGNRSYLKPGSFVVAAGNSFGFEGSVTSGIISGLERTIVQGEHPHTDMLQMTAPVNPGDQGGAVIDSRGRFAGLINGTFQRKPPFENPGDVLKEVLDDVELPDIEDQDGVPNVGKLVEDFFKNIEEELPEPGEMGEMKPFVSSHLLSSEGVHFATPVDTVEWVVDDLIEHGEVQRGFIGVRVGPLYYQERMDRDLPADRGVEVQQVTPNGPAEKAGIQSDDIIVTVNGKPITSAGRLQKVVERSESDTKLDLEIIRDQSRQTLTVTVEPFTMPDEKQNSE